jgi:hypothetical protein
VVVDFLKYAAYPETFIKIKSVLSNLFSNDKQQMRCDMQLDHKYIFLSYSKHFLVENNKPNNTKLQGQV